MDGPGLRTSIYLAGCKHHCPGCHNPESWNMGGGEERTLDELMEVIAYNEAPVTFSGGEPMCQPEAFLTIAKECKKRGLNIMCYTGFTYEEVLTMAKTKPIYREILNNIDVLVDGRFILAEKDLNILFRGSRNQRLIDMPKTLSRGEVVLFDEYAYNEEETFKRKPMYV